MSERRIRTAEVHELDDVMHALESSRSFMRARGNPQWERSFPTRAELTSELSRGTLMVCEEEGEGVVGCFVLAPGPDPCYLRIDDGDWLDDGPYFVVHRFATLRQGNGVGSFMMAWLCETADSLRMDTHELNLPMQGLLERHGFRRCGVICLSNGEERLAYQYLSPTHEPEPRGILEWLPWRKGGLGR
ncbi:GNAT family N-acetyltransferase [Olsenella phocaeensis]|uniref:GNAT family N-acetyltransferase n=1 Tax=Olsenella phocaeensis TaxID=1852385 RepID=UPI000931FD65|nr:GNAT family N-acetyltransferase [Olsenella phocaeensis]